MTDQHTTADPAPTDEQEAPHVEQQEQAPAVDPAPASDPAPTNEQAQQDVFDRDYVEKLRKEAADYRTKRKEEAERAAQLEAELTKYRDGLKNLFGEGEAEKTPEDIIASLTAERDQAAQQLAQMRTDQALTAAATQAGADAELLTLVLKGKGALTDLDPTADDFAAQVAALVDAEVAANPKLRATPAVPQSSGSTPEDTTSPRTGQLTRADMANMTPREINEAVAAGRFRDVLGG